MLYLDLAYFVQYWLHINFFFSLGIEYLNKVIEKK